MKLNIDPQWIKRAAELEDGCCVTAISPELLAMIDNKWITIRADLLTPTEAAKSLGVTYAAIKMAVLEKRIEYTQLYGRILFTPEAIEAYRNRTQPEGKKSRGRPRNKVITV